MELNEGRAPQVTNTILGKWITANYVAYQDETIRKNGLPQSGNDGEIIFNTVDNKYYQYDANATPNWVCLGPNYSHNGDLDLGILPAGGSALELYDCKSEGFINLFMVYDTDADSPNPMPAPLLMTDQGFIVKKDLMVGGFVDSGQGALWLNYGLKGRPELSTPPLIQMMSSLKDYPFGISFPDPGERGYEKGQLFNLTEACTWNGHSYAADKYMWNGSDWVTGNFSGYYDTLFLFKSDGISPAHLDLGNLTSHGEMSLLGQLTVGGSITSNEINVSRHKWLSLASDDGQGTTRLFSFTPGEVHVQALINGNWDLGQITAGKAKIDFIEAAQTGSTTVYLLSNLKSSQASQSNSILQGFKSGEANARFGLLVSGEMYWGAGGASAADTNLYRSAADTLKTDDAFVHGGLVSLNYSGEVDLDFKADNAGGWRVFERNSDDTLGIYSLTGSQTYLRLVAGTTKQVKVEADNGLYVINDHKVGGTVYTQNDVVFTANNYNVHLSPVASNVLAVKDNNGSLAVIEGATAKVDHLTTATASYIYSWNHLKMTTYADIYPETSNASFVGLSDHYWSAVYANYLLYKTSHGAFDTLDDLAIAKSLTTVKETRIIDEKTKETAEFDVIGREQLRFLEDGNGFYSPDRVNGYLLGCVKALVLRIEALENQLANEAAA
jgi:hypothetical protein